MGRLVMADGEEAGVAEFAVDGPLWKQAADGRMQTAAKDIVGLQKLRNLGMRSLFPHNFTRIFVGSHAKQPWMAELSILGPLDESHLHDNFWTHPMRSQSR